MWSLGVMLYILLSGLPPFWGDDESQIFKSVLKVRLSGLLQQLRAALRCGKHPNIFASAELKKALYFFTALQRSQGDHPSQGSE